MGYLLVCPVFPVCSGLAFRRLVRMSRSVVGRIDGVVPQPKPVRRDRPGPTGGPVQGGSTFGGGRGPLMILRRRVDPRTEGVRSPASTPAVRSRLWSIAAHRIQAELAPKRPDGTCASGPSISLANTVSMIAWWR